MIIGAQALVAFAEDTIEEIVVMGKSIKASTQSSLEAKRMADNVSDVISADAMGRFPDQNLADALGRVPGIAIERDQGQARYVSFRGAPKRYTTTAFDGVDIPGVENGRVPRFDAYPTVITSQVVANKAITADMPGESISGYINVKTLLPSDIDGWSFSLEAGVGEQDLGGGDVEKFNARVSYSNDQFGFVVYGSENLREQITDNREHEYLGTAGALIPVQLDFRNYRVKREDNAFGGTLEYYLDNGGRVFFSSLNTEFTDKEERNQWNFYFPGAETPQSGTIASGNVRRLLEDGIYTNETDVNTIGAEFTFGEWDIEAKYSNIETLFDTYLPIPYLIGGGQISNVFYDVSDAEEPIVTFDENLGDLAYGLKLMIDAVGGLETETDQFKIDLSRANKWGVVKFGAKFDTRDASGGGAPLDLVIGGLPSVDVGSFDEGPWDTDLDNTVGGYYSDNKGLLKALEAAGVSRSDFPDDGKVQIEEDIISVYAMQTIDMDWGNIILGLRIEDTDYKTVGSKLVGAVYEPLSVNNSYTNVLPSAHVNWDFREDTKLRLSFSTGISRPSYIEARAAATIDPIGMAIGGGNPQLDEEKSWGIDAAYEWYFADASLLSVTVFYRSIDNVISESSEKVLGSIYSDIAAPGELWDLTAFGNGKDGELQGIEIAFTGRLDNYMDGFLSGFGIEANLTLIDSEYTTPEGGKFELPGQSDTNYNLSVFYEDHGLSARLSYRYRDAWLDETEAGHLNTPTGIYWDEQERVDLSLRYELAPLVGHDISLFANFNNLTDETDVRYTGKDWNPNQAEAYGRRYLVGFRYSL
ncbi:MAG TPA: TonB-dependent receptor [Pseudomonadales bacterium]|nr:TonB-dependent receptor [Pseudomonadales bacterium]